MAQQKTTSRESFAAGRVVGSVHLFGVGMKSSAGAPTMAKEQGGAHNNYNAHQHNFSSKNPLVITTPPTPIFNKPPPISSSTISTAPAGSVVAAVSSVGGGTTSSAPTFKFCSERMSGTAGVTNGGDVSLGASISQAGVGKGNKLDKSEESGTGTTGPSSTSSVTTTTTTIKSSSEAGVVSPQQMNKCPSSGAGTATSKSASVEDTTVVEIMDKPTKPSRCGGGDKNGAGEMGKNLLDGFGEEVGQDVRQLVMLLEGAGFLRDSPNTNRSEAPIAGEGGGMIRRMNTAPPPPARPSTAEKSYVDAFMGRRVVVSSEGSQDVECAFAHDPNKRTKEEGTTPSQQPRTATSNNRKELQVGGGESESPKGAVPGGRMEPKDSRNARMSSPRAASASATSSTKVSSTATTPTTGSAAAPSPRGKSVGEKELTTTGGGGGRPKTAVPSIRTSTTNFSSTLYQHTASSAQKGTQHHPSPTNTTPPTPLFPKGSPSGGTTTTPKTSNRPRTSTTPRNKMGDSTAGAGGDKEEKPASLKDQFSAFSRFGDAASDGKHITLSNSDKWMKQAKVVDGKKITTTDTSICFKKLFKTVKKVGLEDFKKYVEELGKSKQLEPQTLLDKLTNCGPPGVTAATKAAHTGVVDRLTDTSKYTGSHKERFDASGKGKGIDGRRDVADNSGYVASFKDKLDLNKGGESHGVKGGSPSPTPSAPPAKESTSPTPPTK